MVRKKGESGVWGRKALRGAVYGMLHGIGI
jgi:hypothetical protein